MFQVDWWDGDGGGTTHKDRGRSEVKGLGAHQLEGETYDYVSTWRTSSNWVGTNLFAHIFQLFGVQGTDGTGYMVQNELDQNNTGHVEYVSDSGASGTARTYTHGVGTWLTQSIRVKPSLTGNGLVQVSNNGDAFEGPTGVALYQEGDGYRPKWGLYRGFAAGQSLGTHYVEQKTVQAFKPTSGFSGYYKLLAGHTGKAAVVASASTTNNASVVQYEYTDNATDNDEWELRTIGSGYYRIIGRQSGKDMVVAGASTANSASVIQYTYGGSGTNDEWQPVSLGNGRYKVVNRNSGKVLTVQGASTANNAFIIQYDYSTGTANDEWQIVSVP